MDKDNNVYYWVVREETSNGFSDRSNNVFKTEQEAYDDMMRAAIGKMKWGHLYDEDFNNGEEGYYEVKWSIAVKQVVLTQHTGNYVYQLIEVNREKMAIVKAIGQLLASTTENGKFEFKEEDVRVSLNYCGKSVEQRLASLYLDTRCFGEVAISTEIYHNNGLNGVRGEFMYKSLTDYDIEELRSIFDEFIFYHLMQGRMGE